MFIIAFSLGLCSLVPENPIFHLNHHESINRFALNVRNGDLTYLALLLGTWRQLAATDWARKL